MNRMRILVEGEDLDLFPDTIIAQNLKAFEIGDLVTRSVNYTSSFKVPLSDNNKRIFGNSQDPRSSSLVPYRTQQSKLIQNGIEYFNNGILNLIRARSEYEISVFSGAKGFFQALGDKKLSDLTGYFSLRPDNFPASRRNATDGIVYPVAHYGTDNGRGILKEVQDGETNVSNDCFSMVPGTYTGVVPTSTTGLGTGATFTVIVKPNGLDFESVEIEDVGIDFEIGDHIVFDAATLFGGVSGQLTIRVLDTERTVLSGVPFIYDHSIIDSIFTQAGYTYSGAAFSDSKFLKRITMANGKSGRYTDSFIQKRKIEAYVSTTQSFLVGGGGTKIQFTGVRKAGSNPEGYWDGTENYLASDTDAGASDPLYYLRVKFTVRITVTGGTIDLKITNITGDPDIENIGSGLYTFETVIDSDSFDSVKTTIGNASYANNAVFLKATINSGTPTVDVHQGSITIEPAGIVTQFIYYNALLPEMRQADFIKEFAMRSGVIFDEKYNNVEVKSFDEIIADRANAKDWTNKRIPKTDGVGFTPLQYGQLNRFRYSQTSGISEFIGVGQFEVDNENIEPTQDIFTSSFNNVDSTYKSDILLADVPVFDEAEFFPEFQEYQEDPGKVALLVRDKYTGEPDVYYPDNVTYGNYIVAYFEDPDQSDTMAFQQDLDENYPLFIESLQRAKIVERDYMLTEMDIAEFTFFVPIFDRDSYYLVNEIKNFVSGFPTTVELFKV